MAHESVAFEETKRNFWDRPSRSLLPVRRFGRPAEGTTPDSAGNARTAAAAMLIAFAIFALFNSQGIRHFTRDLPGNAFTDILVNKADQWHGLMQRLGAAKLAPAVKGRFDRLRDIRW
ncbi:MAG: hypothetical protein K9G60_11835 [Pseudolabrys sp.]|nr:hypothetical protein [Pseudolabrys sp.]